MQRIVLEALLTTSQKWSGGVIWHKNGLLTTEKIVGHAYIFIEYGEKKFISQFLLDYISAIIT